MAHDRSIRHDRRAHFTRCPRRSLFLRQSFASAAFRPSKPLTKGLPHHAGLHIA